MTHNRKQAFTLIELLVVISIIAILASLVLSAAHFVQVKGFRDRASAEIAALGAALESYKADNGDYPTNGTFGSANPGSANLVAALMPTNGKVYFEFKPKLTNSHGYLDPFGTTNYNYNYDTNGSMYNGTNNYDLWSTVGGSASNNTWIKNW